MYIMGSDSEKNKSSHFPCYMPAKEVTLVRTGKTLEEVPSFHYQSYSALC